MNVSRKFQTINTFRTDATGNNIIRSMEFLSPDVTSSPQPTDDFYNRYRPKDYLGLSFFSAPLEDSRTRFNTSYSISTDNTIVLSVTRDESASGNSVDLLNGLSVVRRFSDRKYFSFSMLTQYSENEESMSVFSSSGSDSALQNINVRLFYNNLSSGFSLRFSEHLTLSSRTSLQFLWRDFHSLLGGFELPAGDAGMPASMSNDINMLSVKPQERLSLNYLGRKKELSVFVDAWYQYVYGQHRAAGSPGVSFKYTFGQRLYVTASASYSLSPINEQEMYGGLICSRNMRRPIHSVSRLSCHFFLRTSSLWRSAGSIISAGISPCKCRILSFWTPLPDILYQTG